MNGNSAGEAGVATFLATDGAVISLAFEAIASHDLPDVFGSVVRLLALRTETPAKTLSQHHVERRGQQVALDAHVEQSRDCAAGVVRVQRAEDQMPGQRCLNRNASGVLVTYFADQDRVRVLSQQTAQHRGERESDLLVGLELIDSLKLELDRIFDRADVRLDRVDRVERGVQRRALAAAGWAGDECDAVRLLQLELKLLVDIAAEAELLQRKIDRLIVEHTDHDLLAELSRQRADTEVDRVLLHHHMDASVLRKPTLADVERRHDLDA